MDNQANEKANQVQGVKRIYNAFFYSWAGLKAAYHYEAAFRQEFVLACLLVPIACLLPIGITLRALMVLSVILVLIVEILNSAIEAVVDRISQEQHILSKRAKDMGSAAVFLSLINLLGMWILGLWGLF
ncbi:MAG: diacylglycerol kinase [SAR324 cluster bacterium]|nr:diacylglycerol kinase [SAR324 cluster bacterium]